jgi:hypothetical protein
MNLVPDKNGDCHVGEHIREVVRQNKAMAAAWPGDGFNLHSLLRNVRIGSTGPGKVVPADAGAPEGEEENKNVPTYFHSMELNSLVNAVERAGFQVELAQYGRHPGYPACYHHDGKENTQVVAVKPC